ncbi:PI31 proteasome regulator N-terminal-domain-containing protein [Diplogelasinospora grovesii]|uniref:PI31 proteasome regulator N-terminal-domain-containing protein n=1 Tax=Diplogelasinospora grovesii TaxID=303347 RepID=A0AAN6S7H2_9PEZI|nr:PI31 proteasome regulator N-terminal-domain-containing protein [Diplogelasinospora grovesii]
MSQDPLHPSAVLKGMAEALPAHDKDDTTSDLSSSLEAIALYIHACMVNLGFRLLGFNEDKKIEAECARLAPRLPAQWNNSPNTISFVYAHTQSSMQFVIRVDRMGGKAEIRGLGVGHERIYRFEIAMRDYVQSSELPVRINTTTTVESDGSQKVTEDRDNELFLKLSKVFNNSEEKMSELSRLLKVNIVQQLLPGLHKPGYEEAKTETSPQSASRTQPLNQPDALRSPRPGPDFHPQPNPLPNPYPTPSPIPVATGGRRGPTGDFPPPGFDDEYDIMRPPGGGQLPNPLQQYGRRDGRGGEGSPYSIGQSDLYPQGLGPHDPMRGSFVPAPGQGPGGFGGGGTGGSGGMHPTFDDPLFQGPRGGGGGQPGQGGGEFDPQIPPGARWDPIGPGGAPRFGGGRGNRGGGGGYGGYGGFGGDII